MISLCNAKKRQSDVFPLHFFSLREKVFFCDVEEVVGFLPAATIFHLQGLARQCNSDTKPNLFLLLHGLTPPSHLVPKHGAVYFIFCVLPQQHLLATVCITQ